MRKGHNTKISLLILLFFVLLSVLMLWPLPKHMSDTLISEVDPLLNTWILSWDIHQLFKDPLHLFDANIFYPLKNTLAFSEHLIVLSLIAMPVSLISGNPILGYNFVQLIAFILCGFTAYLLVYHLTGNRIAAIIAGIIFTFHPFRFRQIGHIQNIAVFWTPLCLLYLHKFFKKPTWKHVLLFALFFICQALSCGYMAVFLSLVIGLAILYYFLFIPKKDIMPVMKKFAVSVLLAAIIIAPFLYPYLQVKKEHEFKRSIENNIRVSANIMSYATISRLKRNIVYYPFVQEIRRILHREREEILRPLGKGLFPGVITLILVLCAFVLTPFSLHAFKKEKKWTEKKKGVGERLPRIAKATCAGMIILSLILIVLIVLFGGIDFTLLGLDIKLTKLTIPVYLFLIFFIIRLALTRTSIGILDDEKSRFLIHRNFYLFIAVVSFILSFGPKIYYLYCDLGDGPYMFLYKYLFFFEGIRVPERFGILVMLGLSVLAGYGMVRLMKVLKNRGRIILGLVVSGLLIYEFICVPLPSFEISREPKDVYRWLASDKEQYGVLEYPFETLQQDKYYMYWSTFHWKNLANGSSGFNPRLITRLRRLAHEREAFPDKEFIEYIKTQVLVKYLILHLGDMTEKEKEDILENANRFSEDLKLVKTFDDNDHVFEVIYDNEVMTSY
ncbi:MAG: glycosyltransferase family 39 protein [Candidatus Aminicenantes bacterium]|nr:glycosyltransferase family 39 protein [Candidatus Aminicenantes bacterium]MDH5385616.1 glycosyltransferase family 39 protein [Candidatus Aminicenantes bacterium]MDH5742419.1 glycosyltransferase family 39 protein [Candidatus Aminicenantes bacterium]